MNFVSLKKLLIVSAVIFLLSFFVFSYFQFNQPIEVKDIEIKQVEEVYSFTGKVSETDFLNSQIKVLPTGKDELVSVFISAETVIYKVSIKDPEELISKTKKEEVGIGAIEVGNPVFIRSNSDIYNKSKLNDIKLIEILF